jgi:hypothetical protein
MTMRRAGTEAGVLLQMIEWSAEAGAGVEVAAVVARGSPTAMVLTP